jgi:hypothetical protein
MHLDTVEARLLRQRGGAPVVADQPWDLLGSERARHGGGSLRTALEEDEFTCPDRRGGLYLREAGRSSRVRPLRRDRATVAARLGAVRYRRAQIARAFRAAGVEPIAKQ